MLSMSVRDNITLAALRRVSRGLLDRRSPRRPGRTRLCGSSHIKAPPLDSPVGTLSGGNQQKVVMAKWLMTEPRIILLNDPTRGIDVGTKQELYALLRTLADAGRRDPVLQHRL